MDAVAVVTGVVLGTGWYGGDGDEAMGRRSGTCGCGEPIASPKGGSWTS